MHFAIFLGVGILLFQKVLSKSISNGTTVENRTDALEKSFETLLSRFNNVSETVYSLQNRVQNEMKRPIFYVELSGSRNLNHYSIVKFDTQFIDEGNNFNTGDGIFVAPIPGVYLFIWTIQTYTSKAVQTELRVDNIVKGKQFTSLGSGAGHFGTTRTVLCSVNKGDHVWIQTDNHYTDNYLYDGSGGVRSSFMGIFIQKV
ncbi:C1QL [Mytilus edulis]|uniref:C1QL n=1 Tax=Mytilus edulis TaxID=6550 RepID=A0A8S3PZF6_MYTED|nr:C1QL [Mytilus edulis]